MTDLSGNTSPAAGQVGRTWLFGMVPSIVIPLYFAVKDGVEEGLILLGLLLLGFAVVVLADARMRAGEWTWLVVRPGLALIAGAAVAFALLVVLADEPRGQTDEERVEKLVAGLTVGEFEKALGMRARLTNEVGILRESLFVDNDFFVQVLADENERVVMFSVSARSGRFHPRFEICDFSAPRQPIVFELGRTYLGTLEGRYASAINVSSTSEGIHYTEIRAGSHACDFRWEAYSFNGAVSVDSGSRKSDAQADRVHEMSFDTIAMPDAYGIALGPFPDFDDATIAQSVPLDAVLADPRFAQRRSQLVPNTYTETYGSREFFVRYPAVFSVDPFRVAFGPSREQIGTVSPR